MSINPLRKRGVVALNLRVATELNTLAKTAERPYYRRTEGSQANAYTEVQDGAVVFTVMHDNPAMGALLSCNSTEADVDGSGDNNHISGIDCLDGLFDGEHNHDVINSKIVVQGINERRGAHNLGNCILSGLLSVQNTGPETFYANQKAIAYAMTREEACMTEGPLRLQLRPFNELLHGATPKPIHHCISAIARKDKQDTYLPSYKRRCLHFFEGAKDMGLIAIATLGRAALEDILAKAPTEVALAQQVQKKMGEAAFDARFNNALFPLYSDTPLWLDPSAGPKSELNQRQANAAGRFMRASKAFNDEVERRMVGTYRSTTVPGQYGMFQVQK